MEQVYIVLFQEKLRATIITVVIHGIEFGYPGLAVIGNQLLKPDTFVVKAENALTPFWFFGRSETSASCGSNLSDFSISCPQHINRARTLKHAGSPRFQ